MMLNVKITLSIPMYALNVHSHKIVDEKMNIYLLKQIEKDSINENIDVYCDKNRYLFQEYS